MIHKIYIAVCEFLLQMRKQNVSAHAASTAFFLFLSLVPMLIIVCTLIPFTPLTEEHLVAVLTELTPDMVDPMVKGLIAEVYRKSTGVLSIAILATIWSAGKGVLALMQGLNAVNGVEEERNYFVTRIVASLYTVVMLVVMLLSLFLMVFGNRLVNLTLYKIPQLKEVVDGLMNFRFILVWAILAILFAFVYTFIPGVKLKFREQLIGAVFAAVVWSVFSWLFSVYLDTAGAGSIYGSLSVIVLVMIWMYCCMYIFLVGAYINRITSILPQFSKRK